MDVHRTVSKRPLNTAQESVTFEGANGELLNGAREGLLDFLYSGEDSEPQSSADMKTELNGMEFNNELSSEDDSYSGESDPSGDEDEEVGKDVEKGGPLLPLEANETPAVESNDCSAGENQEEAGNLLPAKRKKNNTGKSAVSENQKGTKKKRHKSKKAHMRRNLKGTTLKKLNPQTFSAHNEELERMLRIGQMDGYSVPTDTESNLPSSIMALLNVSDQPASKSRETETKVPFKPVAMETDIPKRQSDPLVSMSRDTVVATLGEPSSSVAEQDACYRVHTEACREDVTVSKSPSPPPCLRPPPPFRPALSSEQKDVVILLDDSDSDTEPAKPQAVPSHPKPAAGQGPKTGDWRRKYLGLDLIDTTSSSAAVRDPAAILINPGHPASEPDVTLAPQIAMSAKLHQIGGIRFLYDNIIESTQRFRNSHGFGCILAHSMGLGKTLQAIAFTDLFLRYTPSKRVLIVVPVNTMMNWIAEFNQWLPLAKEISPAHRSAPANDGDKSGPHSTMPRSFEVFALNDSMKTLATRFAVIKDWMRRGGVLLIGYEMYRMLSMSVPSIAGNKMAVKRRKKKKAADMDSGVIDLDETEKEMQELIDIQHALCKPGPDLIICDEGHRIRNETTNLSQALKRIHTRRRVVMTGYPLQNNLLEYWCMVDFVRPNYLGDRKEFQTLFERPINNGQCGDSYPEDVRLMKQRCHVLFQSLQGFVLRCDHSILKCSLPAKHECVLYLRPTSIQKRLYDYTYEAAQANSPRGLNPIVAFSTFSKIWNHPEIFHEASTNSKTLSGGLSDMDLLPHHAGKEKEDPLLAGWPAHVTDYRPMTLESSHKFSVLMTILDFTVALGEKLLIFSQSLSTLSLIEKFLAMRNMPKSSQNGNLEYTDQIWRKGVHYLRLDGSTSMSDRETMIDSFNSPKNTDCCLFMLSTRAGCLGINLVAASRVVMVDVSWNPCHDAQAVCRVYRFGQVRATHIYRLVLDGTMERKMYQRQISKQGMSDRVVDELNPERNLASSDIQSLVKPPEEVAGVQDFSGEVEKFSYDVVLMSLCHHFGHMLTRLPFEHESLLLDQDGDKLSEVEKQEAIKDFRSERERTRRSTVYAMPGAGPGQSSAALLPPPQPHQLAPQPAQTFPNSTTAAAVGSLNGHDASQHFFSNHHGVQPGGGGAGGGAYNSSSQLIPPPVNGYRTNTFAPSSSTCWPQVTLRQQQQQQQQQQPYQQLGAYRNLSNTRPSTNAASSVVVAGLEERPEVGGFQLNPSSFSSSSRGVPQLAFGGSNSALPITGPRGPGTLATLNGGGDSSSNSSLAATSLYSSSNSRLNTRQWVMSGLGGSETGGVSEVGTHRSETAPGRLHRPPHHPPGSTGSTAALPPPPTVDLNEIVNILDNSFLSNSFPGDPYSAGTSTTERQSGPQATSSRLQTTSNGPPSDVQELMESVFSGTVTSLN